MRGTLDAVTPVDPPALPTPVDEDDLPLSARRELWRFRHPFKVAAIAFPAGFFGYLAIEVFAPNGRLADLPSAWLALGMGTALSMNMFVSYRRRILWRVIVEAQAIYGAALVVAAASAASGGPSNVILSLLLNGAGFAGLFYVGWVRGGRLERSWRKRFGSLDAYDLTPYP